MKISNILFLIEVVLSITVTSSVEAQASLFAKDNASNRVKQSSKTNVESNSNPNPVSSIHKAGKWLENFVSRGLKKGSGKGAKKGGKSAKDRKKDKKKYKMSPTMAPVVPTPAPVALTPAPVEPTPAPIAPTPSLPEINELINIAYPMWEVDAEGRRLETKDCTVDSCEWNPFYVTKRYDGLHPDLGGHPTDNDVKYAFFGSSPFAGQPYSGTPHHCNINDPDDIKAKDCPKIKTTTDTGPDGPGHVPPHIGLASLTWAVQDNLFSLDEMFYYDFYDCRVIPDVLLKMIRNYFPRTEGVVVDYPPPIVPEGGDFQYEFPSGNGLENQQPPYAPGPPHWCTDEMLATGHWDGVCPYVFEGPDAGKYRHPHIAYAALEVYLANLAMPDKCHTTWLQNNPDFLDPNRVTTDTPFPVMSNDDFPPDSLENWLGQPVLPWTYVSGPPKAAEGTFSSAILYAPRSAEPETAPEVSNPIVDLPPLGSSYCTYAPDYDCWESGWPECCGSDDIECPEQQPACTKVDPLVMDPPLVGTSYCTYAPDYDCWESGWPECCGSDDIECPEQQPACTKVVDTPVIPVDTPVIPVDTPEEDTSNDTSEVDTFETPEEDEPEEDKPGKDNSKKDKPGKDNSKKDKPGKDSSKKDKPGKDNSKKDKPDKKEKPEKMDKPGKDNSKKDNSKKDKPEKDDKPGKDNSKKDNSKKDKPDKKEKPGKDNSKKDNSKKDKPGKKDKDDEPSQAFARFFADGMP